MKKISPSTLFVGASVICVSAFVFAGIEPQSKLKGEKEIAKALESAVNLETEKSEKPTAGSLFKTLDKNTDGSISIEEGKDILSAAVFDKLDVNQDGLISKAEYFKDAVNKKESISKEKAVKESVNKEVSSIVSPE